MELPIHVLAVLARNRFLALPIAFVLCVLIGAAVRRRTGRSASWGALVLLLALLNIMVGPFVSAWLIHRFGRVAEAQTTGSYATSARYNGHDVRGYEVVIRLSDREVVSERFEDDDFNLYPASGGISFPRPGDTFNGASCRASRTTSWWSPTTTAPGPGAWPAAVSAAGWPRPAAASTSPRAPHRSAHPTPTRSPPTWTEAARTGRRTPSCTGATGREPCRGSSIPEERASTEGTTPLKIRHQVYGAAP